MKIHYFATLRDLTRTSEETWAQTPETVADLVDKLCQKYGPEFQKWVSFKDGGFGKLSIILINGRDYRSLGGLQTRLKPGDMVSIFPPIAGG